MAEHFKGDHAQLRDMIGLYEMEDEVIVHKGLIQDTLPPLIDDRRELSFSLIYCDTDLYEPTKVILELLHSRLSRNGLIVFDEWNNPDYPGETVAAQEFLERFGDSYDMEYVANTRNPTCLLRKIRP
jgi:predicted O-methyltransferase YrrM